MSVCRGPIATLQKFYWVVTHLGIESVSDSVVEIGGVHRHALVGTLKVVGPHALQFAATNLNMFESRSPQASTSL